MQYRPHRYQTQFPIQLSTRSGLQQCQVIDVNAGGARIMSAARLQRGEKVKFRVLNHDVAAIVQWTAGDKAGLTFRPQLSAILVDTLRYRRDAPRGLRRGTVGFTFVEM
ncbi:PilZ domain-containing protein [Yoonia sp.]|uniref:PilZ domain-containing protein n=1 Tax=Yoonia sp. TaxID=2212373 RepID=UPI003974D33E